jgi:hypothetical protein
MGRNIRMKEVTEQSEINAIKYALQNTPVNFLGVGVQPQFNHAYYTGIDGVYLVFIIYGYYILKGICIAQEPEIQIYFDCNTMLTIVRNMIDQSIKEYNSISNWRLRGM